MLVLGLESTCDETAAAVVRNGQEILSNVVSSQIDLHSTYGGVVPELACRRHVDVMIPVIDEALKLANASFSDIDLISVAHGPGLVGALLIGVNAAKAISLATQTPFIGVNHVEAHLYAAIMSHQGLPDFPCLGVILSGGHTSIMKIEHIGSSSLIAQTVDDAIGEAFDKVAKLLGLPYPGGPYIEALAKDGEPAYPFKPGKVKERPLDFSFSGLKTAVLYAIKGQNERNGDISLSEQQKKNIAASFQEAAFKDVLQKTVLIAGQSNCSTVLFGGGVTNNQRLRSIFAEEAPQLTSLWPSKGLSLDNAAMIAGLGYHHYHKKGKGDSLNLEVITRF